jgi:Rod binding domain-containing protein
VTLTPVSLATLGLPPAATPTPTRGKSDEVGQQFEAILLGQLLKGLRRTVPTAEEGDASRDLYNELFDETMATHIARSGGIGLGAMVREWLDRSAPSTPAAALPGPSPATGQVK